MILTQIEAKEACEWLKAAGFPQYAQMFEDMQFPIDIKTVRKDHEFLDQDAVDSLYRRLHTLNKCAAMKVEINRQRKRSDESEEDEPCALSNKWTYEKCTQRWSRLESLEGFGASVADSLRLKSIGSGDIAFSDRGERNDESSVHSTSSGDSDLISFPKTFEEVETSRSSSMCSSNKLASPDSTFSCSSSPCETLNIISEDKLLDKPSNKKGRSFLKKMEKLRIRSSSLKREPNSKAKPMITEPILLEGLTEEKLRNLNCVNISDMSNIPMMQSSSYSPQTCSSSSQSENSSTVSTPSPIIKARRHSSRGGMYAEGFDASKLSVWNDLSEHNLKNEIYLHENKVFQVPQGHKPGTFPKALTYSLLSPLDNTAVNWRTGSFHGCHRNRVHMGSQGSETPPGSHSLIDNRLSIYDNVPGSPVHINKMDTPDTGDDDVFTELDNVMEHVNGLRKLVSQWSEKFSDDGDSDSASHSNQSASPCPSSPKEIHLEIKKHSEEKLVELPIIDGEDDCKSASEDRFAELACVTESGIRLTPSCSIRPVEGMNLENLSIQLDRQSAAHLNRIQKLALLKLTSLMDKYTPSSKQGWNWTVPKFIRKIKAPDYKDKNVFGVPLLLNVQRTGHPLPRSILQAMDYLRDNFLDQVGLFRKSGVKSRILSLREMNENDPHSVTYEGQSAFDVADMVKQYFRDLPEPIFTSKLCESFLNIYQYLPKDQQFCAVQAAAILLPDENREALKILLFFLRDVVAFVEENQMTPTNLAVCLAPSLFHLNSLRRESSSSSRSSQRKYSTGRPDQRDLSENLAATQGLAHMIMECHRLFQIPDYCFDEGYEDFHNLNFLTETNQTILTSLCSTVISLEHSMQDLLRDAKEKFRNWVACSIVEGVDSGYKKVEDNCYLRLWRASVEIDATPKAVLHRVLMEQHLWDPRLQQSKILEVLDDDTDIYHYTTESMSPLPGRDHVILRTWRTDPQSGTCVLAATSTESEGAKLNGILAKVFLCQFLIEAVGSHKSKVTHVCRIDKRGQTLEWYNRAFGYICSAELIRIKESFRTSQ
ncbi:PREDICTED: rho GTPase-activating protein 7-like [Gekko japonicus]|uniref:Rho GTPase-activating protein 7-like n=1 Tax=Gekko japonicus TaxID=146911 RepID=A0ABM1JMV9_GEKJA|nr:PREDICTED: rho GTPase-activating protein 7-like [Gekko japonicus]